MSDPGTVYKWLNGREATHVLGFRYRLRAWQPAIEGDLVPCENAYHGCRVEHLSRWIGRDLFVIESKDEWLDAGDKLYTRGPVRIVERLKGWNKQTARLAAADFAEAVLHLIPEARRDPFAAAVNAARGFARGEISDWERDAAMDAAWAAAWDAARAAAEAAAGAAAGAATRAAAWSAAAGAATRAASKAAAWAAAWDAAKAAQGAVILNYAYGRKS